MTALLLSDLAPYDADRLSAAIRDALYWHRNHPVTREDRIAKDEAFVRLSEASARLDMSIRAEGK